MKPGWQTSEFWTTMITKVIGVCITYGVFTASQGQQWQIGLSNAAAGVFAIVSLASLAKTYVDGRNKLKSSQKHT